MYKRILVTTDGTSLSKKAVRGAIDLASSVGAELIALHVVRRYPMSFMDGNVGTSSNESKRIQKERVEHGQAMVDAVSGAAEAEGVSARGIVVQSDVIADTIVATAKKRNCDLIVMASHGRKGLKRILLGSETQQVLTHGTTPTLVLR
jgi:nucleotide-binding universal stress UspA family protein